MKVRTLTIDEREIEGTYIGKGLFCKAYRAENTVYLLCEGDYSKEAIALFADQALKHVPTVERHEDYKGYQVFSMPYYRRLTKQEFPKAFRQWKLVKTLAQGVTRGPKGIEALITNVRNAGEQSLADALANLYEAFSNYDYLGMILEFQKANVGVDHNGELVLRDCLASTDSIAKRRQANYRRFAHAV